MRRRPPRTVPSPLKVLVAAEQQQQQQWMIVSVFGTRVQQCSCYDGSW